ncbi:ectoine/hydroxyectoine ABC transporter substrate-binding protein EhuB [Mesorhizobium sp. YC-39]|uniref:ectoine/hydroxyectoine ABC transporter substrate-binding protein EhuB n=1 Tax=unclassified Mesorhizobium TaxID=325217 RepID=UPI0021E7A803|nr:MULTISPECIES: ectoine/hydroxyectoine ABC transporter substrate-binding protein EhuB [unclassified Mesorhizobium]MCV3211486.1 ectoine/hydroxyectoine ABC transporter substrate-binding protein EhuB [Mesorhizobium sp. YC-2]MCV3233158.1 ectoine/hydroxyectoine ABC transporter substrate-binding protein EhuB [Mesorhizobium sp. YC-39]
MKLNLTALTALLGLTLLSVTNTGASAGPVADRIASGQPIRIGFASEIPYAYPDANNQPAGFANVIALGALKEMGYTNIEPVVTEWGGLIPGLQSGRFDIITGGMYILKSRCENVLFAEPLAKTGEAFIVPPGNPKGLSNYKDLVSKNATMVANTGSSVIEQAKKDGVQDSQIIQVPGIPEILATVESGRADAGVSAYLILQDVAKKAGSKVEVTDPTAFPESYQNWVGIAFSKDDAEFVAKFNEAQKKFIGTPEMMKAVAPYGYDKTLLPGDKTAEWVCANR